MQTTLWRGTQIHRDIISYCWSFPGGPTGAEETAENTVTGTEGQACTHCCKDILPQPRRNLHEAQWDRQLQPGQSGNELAEDKCHTDVCTAPTSQFKPCANFIFHTGKGSLDEQKEADSDHVDFALHSTLPARRKAGCSPIQASRTACPPCPPPPLNPTWPSTAAYLEHEPNHSRPWAGLAPDWAKLKGRDSSHNSRRQ